MNLQELLKEIISGKSLYYGTTLMVGEACGLWWSPYEWNSPIDAMKAQPHPGKWLFLGYSGWWANDE